MFRPSARLEYRRVHSVPHFHEIVERQIGDDVRVLLASFLVGGQGPIPVLVRLGKASVDLNTVLERTVRTLPEERDDGVRGVSDQGDDRGRATPTANTES